MSCPDIQFLVKLGSLLGEGGEGWAEEQQRTKLSFQQTTFLVSLSGSSIRAPKWTDGLSPSDSCIRDPWWSFVQLFKHNLEVTSFLEVKSGQPITPIIQKSRTVKWSVYHNLRVWSAGYQMKFFSSRGEWGGEGERVQGFPELNSLNFQLGVQKPNPR